MKSKHMGNNPEDMQDMIDEWKDIQRRKFQVEEAESRLTQKLESYVGDQLAPSFIFTGITSELVLKPRLNVTYKKERGEIHPLENLQTEFPDLASMVRASYSESGSKIKLLLLKYHEPNHGNLSAKNTALAEELIQHRKVKKGKPTISIQDAKNDPPSI